MELKKMQTVYHFKTKDQNSKNILDGFIKWMYTKEHHGRFVTESQAEIAEILVFDQTKNDQFFKGKGTRLCGVTD